MSLRAVAERLPSTYTGADLYALCSDAMLKAVTRQAAAVDANMRAVNAGRAPGDGAISTAHFFDLHATADDVAVLVTESDFDAARRELVPSVSAGELAHYERVREAFEGSRRRGAAARVQGRRRSRVRRQGQQGHGQGHEQGRGQGQGQGQGGGVHKQR